MTDHLAIIERYVEKIEDWSRLSRDPLVSVSITTYNHEGFIAQAIEGALMQETDFPYEIIIAEDKSTDRTREIVLDYQQRYPDKICLRLAKENLYSKNKRYPGLGVRMGTRGKYIALCEGDDYWTDPQKLQKQVDFLEANEEYVLTFHDAKIIDATGRVVEESKLSEVFKKEYAQESLMKGPFLLTMSLCYRNVLTDYPPEYFEVLNGDTFVISLLGQHGKGKYQQNIEPAVYRVHDGGIWSALTDLKKSKARYNTYRKLNSYYTRIGYLPVRDNFFHKAMSDGNKVLHAYHGEGKRLGYYAMFASMSLLLIKNKRFKALMGFAKKAFFG